MVCKICVCLYRLNWQLCCLRPTVGIGMSYLLKLFLFCKPDVEVVSILDAHLRKSRLLLLLLWKVGSHNVGVTGRSDLLLHLKSAFAAF